MKLTITQDQENWRKWTTETLLSYRDIDVPPGFTCDGASIPRFLWAILPTWGRYAPAAVVHDYLYSRLRSSLPHSLASTRREADKRFFEIMVDLGVNTTIRWIMWAAVRSFGWMAVR